MTPYLHAHEQLLCASMMEASITKKYNTRPGRRVDYKASSDIVLPVAKRSRRSRQIESELYPVEVLERDEEAKRVKVHYTGYGSSDDEWKDEDDIVDFTQEHEECDLEPQYLITPTFNLYQQLALKIKISLQSSRKGNPEVRISMDFDKLLFDGGIMRVGTLKTKQRGQEKYTIKKYSDLDEFLGSKWFIRGINSNGDFCYVMLKTVCFYLSKKSTLVDFYPSDQQFKKCIYHRGYNLVFNFVRVDGVANDFASIYMSS